VKLVLIGLRGTGKSTVGKVLAERLSWRFYDTDTLVQERAALTIRQIFETEGEASFRTRETAVVQEVAQNDACVIATGGGAILNPENVLALKRDAFVVHLSADPSELWRRISQDTASHASRPALLPGTSGPEELRKLMLARASLYAQARDAEVDVEGRTPDAIADKILLLMRTHGKQPV
jgi:shikimate kinase